MTASELYEQIRPTLESVDTIKKRQDLLLQIVGTYSSIPDQDYASAIKRLHRRPAGKRYTLDKEHYNIVMLQKDEYLSLSAEELVALATRNSTWLRVAFFRGEPLRLPAGDLLLRSGVCEVTGQPINLSGMGNKSRVMVIELEDEEDNESWYFGGNALTITNATLIKQPVYLSGFTFHNPAEATISATSERGVVLDMPLCTLLHATNVQHLNVSRIRLEAACYRTRLYRLNTCRHILIEDCYFVGGNAGHAVGCKDLYRTGLNSEGADVNLTLDIYHQDETWAFTNDDTGENVWVINSTIRKAAHGFQFWGGDGVLRDEEGAFLDYKPLEWPRGIKDVYFVNLTVDGSTSGCWGALGEHIRYLNCKVKNCRDVGLDFESCIDGVADVHCSARDCGFYTGGANNATFGINDHITFSGKNIVSDSSIPFTGIDPNVPEGQPSCKHFFLTGTFNDIGEGNINYNVNLKDLEVICENGIMDGIRFVTPIHEFHVERCSFTNVEPNFGVVISHKNSFNNCTFTYTQEVPRNIVPLTLTTGKPLAGLDGDTEANFNTFSYSPGINPTFLKIDCIAFNYWAPESGRSRFRFIGNKCSGDYQLNYKFIPDDEDEDYYTPNADTLPIVEVRDNVDMDNFLLEKTTGLALRDPVVNWHNNRRKDGTLYNYDKMLVRYSKLLSYPDSELYSVVDRWYYVCTMPAWNDPLNFADLKIRLHCSNDATNKWTFEGNFGTRGGSDDSYFSEITEVRGLYALDQRSAGIHVYHRTEAVTNVRRFYVWIAAGYNKVHIEIESTFQHLVEGGFRMFEDVGGGGSGPGGEPLWNSNWDKPNRWIPLSKQDWFKFREIEMEYAGIQDGFWEVLRHPASKRPNVVLKHEDDDDPRELLYPPGDMDAGQQDGGNFSVTAFSRYIGYYERYGIPYPDFTDLQYDDLLPLFQAYFTTFFDARYAPI